jgi:uncharacterized protein
MPESLIKQYYDNLKQGKLLAAKCDACGHTTFPPTTACERCGCMNIKNVTLSGKGKLLFVTNSIAPPPNPRFIDIAPYAYGHVQLEEGIYVQGIVTNIGITPDELKKAYEKGPVPVKSDIIDIKGLSILAFKVEGV